jgi:hypothetical protein
MLNVVIKYHRYSVIVQEATVQMGLDRIKLREEAKQDAESLFDFGLKALRMLTYPDLMAATIEFINLPSPFEFEDFLNIPDAMLQKWEDAVYSLNPHWLSGKDSQDAVNFIAQKFIDIQRRIKDEKDLPPELPESITLNHSPETVYQLYQVLKLSGWQWDINTVLAQPESWLGDVLQVGTIDNIVREMINGK